MAAASLLTLLDDLVTLLDDVAAMTKTATTHTVGVVADDLAVNAEQVTGLASHREWPVVWAVAKGSLVNKAAVIPGALLISALLPGLIQPLLMLGGAFLCFEGFEKLIAGRGGSLAARSEAERVAGAVRTDLVLSAEIIIIALGTVATSSLVVQAAVLAAVAVLVTVGVYGLVALIVKLDDVGLALVQRGGRSRALGRALLVGSPQLMRGVAVVGTAAMFLVGGGMLAHGVPALAHWLGTRTAGVGSAVEAALGLGLGAACSALAALVRRAWGAAHEARRS